MTRRPSGPTCVEREHYALQVRGGSLEPELPDGCVVIVEPAAGAPLGALVVADTEDGVLLGRLGRDDRGVFLTGEPGPRGDALRLTGSGPITVRGRVVQRAAARGLARKRYD